MIDNQPNPPHLAQSLLRALLRPQDTEAIPGDLLEEYREVRSPALGRIGADFWYIKHVLSVLWRVVWPCVAAIAALRILAFALPRGWNPSLIPAPGVSLLDASVFLWAGYYGARRTGRLATGVVSACTTSLLGFIMFLLVAGITTPSLFLAPFEKPFIFVILSVLFAIAVVFGTALGTLGAAVGRRSAPPHRRVT